ncbi:SEFIR domain-containing protein [Amycolatopsis magusensis]|uniref:SEFIR domain-containing protein n=1 Tax=Amycolatopsis magusensis TaxID=882444 RepID=UPI0024A7F8DD|nr:SEFIR domain-containing protein [Amycolatopsis magusensis]MDI5976742.1 TIR domain-containing protein [Amycolatopsis magusensis]
MDSTPGVTIDLTVADQDSKRFGSAPSPIKIGAVRMHGWQVHPISVASDQFDGADAYLVKFNYELGTTPDTPEMNWFELGVELREGVVVDAIPHHTQPTQTSVSYIVNDHLNLVPATNGVTPAAHLPATGETIHVFGVGSSGVRWQYWATSDTGVRWGSRVAWLVTLVDQETTHLDLTTIVRFDQRPTLDWNVLPAVTPADLRIELPTATNPRAEVTTQPANGTTVALLPSSPRVFISYTHDNNAHKQLVRDFANLLIKCGLDVRLDQFASPARKDWFLWANDNIDNADFVIIIASPKCLAVGEGKIDRNEHPGMHCELGIMRDRLQGNRRLWEQKLLPVVLPGESLSNIPVFLQPQAMDRYEIDELTEDALGDLLAAIHHGTEDNSRSPVVLMATSARRALADS